jgi:hypothetical protein
VGEGASLIGLRPFLFLPYSRTSWKKNSTKFAVASGLAETTLRGLGWGYAGFLTPIGVMLAAFVARNRCERAQVVACQLPENSRNHTWFLRRVEGLWAQPRVHVGDDRTSPSARVQRQRDIAVIFQLK